jgi:hypothetical protein
MTFGVPLSRALTGVPSTPDQFIDVLRHAEPTPLGGVGTTPAEDFECYVFLNAIVHTTSMTT